MATESTPDRDKPEQPARAELDERTVLECVQQAARLGYWWWDFATEQLYWSDALRELMGVGDRSNLGCRDLLDQVHPDDRATVERELKRALLDHKSYDIVHRLAGSTDGDTRYVRQRGRLERDEQGGPEFWLSTVQDITEEEREKQLYKEEYYWLDTLINAMPAIVCFKDGDGRWLVANEFDLQLFDLEGVDYKGKTDAELAEFSDFHHDALLNCIETDEAAWRLGETSIDEEQIPTSDGELKVFETTKVPLFYEDGSRKGLVVIGRDLTRLREAETTSRRLGRILEDSYNEIYVFDAETLGFLQVNRGARQNLGYSPDEIAELTLMDITGSYDGPEEFQERVESLRDGEVPLLSFEGLNQRKDASTYPVDVRLIYSEREDPPVYVAIAQDISERKRVERMKDEFISIVSHELRTPLTPITGVLAMLDRDQPQECNEMNRRMISIARRNADRLAELIEDLLEFRNLSADSSVFDMQVVDVGGVARETIERNRDLEHDYGISFDFDCDDPTLAVRADRARLSDVITHLLTNAAKFSPEGGVVTVGLGRGDGQVHLSVSDQGPGIPEEVHDQIFDKFWQADSSLSRKTGGAGLGLTLSRAIVEQHGGTITFSSAEGEGTTFRVSLPEYRD